MAPKPPMYYLGVALLVTVGVLVLVIVLGAVF